MKKILTIALAVLAVAGCRNKENEEPVAAGSTTEQLVTPQISKEHKEGRYALSAHVYQR